MLTVITCAALAFTAPTSVSRSPTSTRGVTASRSRLVVMKNTPEETPEVRPEININKNSIVEFHDPKHGSGSAPPVLGIVQGAEYKAKGGARIQVIDANGSMHQIKESAIHVNVGAYKGKLVEPSDILSEYEAVLAKPAGELGIDVADLEMAWELVAEESKNVSPRNILTLIDEKFFSSSLDAYKAFRLLTSDLGRIFFKTVNANEFKAKAAKAVQASKENWCREQDDQEWCFV